MPAKAQSRSRPLPLAALLVITILSCARTCSAQQIPPLQGQGVDPLSAGVASEPVPVFVSVELLKLLGLDEQQYQFQALLQFQLSWADPRTHSIFKVVDAQAAMMDAVVAATARCGATMGDKTAGGAVLLADVNSTDCQLGRTQPPPCSKFCSTFGTATDNQFRCCDSVWLPDVSLPNLLDTSDGRVTTDLIWQFSKSGVHRQTQVLGSFSANLEYQTYPFDRQQLQVLVEPSFTSNKKTQSEAKAPFTIVPSAAFRRYAVVLSQEHGGGSLSTMARSELAGWVINSVTFSCANKSRVDDGSAAPPHHATSEQTQAFSPDDLYNEYYGSNGELAVNPANLHLELCALTIDVSRLSGTAVVQSIVPVSFICALSFVVFFTSPEAIDVRLVTDVTLFLALTTVQFIFVSVLPLTSYLTNFDTFILLSYCLIMAIVLENLIVAYICTRKTHKQKQRQSHGEAHHESELAALAQRVRDAYEHEAHEKDVQREHTGATPLKPLGSRDGAMLEKEEEQPAEVKGEPSWVGRLNPFLRIWTGVGLTLHRCSEDPAFAYKLACNIDRTAAVGLLTLYIILSIVNFTAGLA